LHVYITKYFLVTLSHNHEEDGADKEIKGRLREAAGVFTDNKRIQEKGRIERAKGKAQQKIGRMKRKLRDDDLDDEEI
jgi:uncharacterized protein YjbJ (UPF0337 family)